MKDRLQSPEWWFFIGLFLAALGLLMRFLGYRTVAIWLTVPLLAEIAILVLVVFPFLIYSNWKMRIQGKGL